MKIHQIDNPATGNPEIVNLETETILQNRNVRPTAMRMLVYEYMAKQRTAVSLSDIESNFDKAERTTLFRSLKTFEENGVVHKIDDGTGVAKYALCETDCHCELETDLHLHFHCTKCDETVCLTEYKLPKISLPKKYHAEDANLVVKGLCDSCS